MEPQPHTMNLDDGLTLKRWCDSLHAKEVIIEAFNKKISQKNDILKEIKTTRDHLVAKRNEIIAEQRNLVSKVPQDHYNDPLVEEVAKLVLISKKKRELIDILQDELRDKYLACFSL